MIRSEAGMAKFKAMFILALLGLAIYVGVKIVPVYMDAGRMEDTMSTKARVAQVLKDEEIMRDLVSKAKELDLPLKEENFILNRDMESRKMTISTAWDVEVHFFGDFYVWNHHFAPTVTENIMQ